MPTSAPRHGFQKPGTAGGVPQRVADLIDSNVQAPVKFNERAIWPELLADLFSANDLARTLHQKCQELIGLALKFDLQAILVKLAFFEIQFEHAESKSHLTLQATIHGRQATTQMDARL